MSALLGGAGPELADALGLDGLGLSRLKSFLEEMLRGKYLTNLQCIVPQLQCARHNDKSRSITTTSDTGAGARSPATTAAPPQQRQQVCARPREITARGDRRVA